MLPIHPALLLATWIVFAALIPWLAAERLLVCSLLLLPMFWNQSIRTKAAQLFRRAGVLLLMMVLLYGFFTPGQPVVNGWSWSVSHEGLVSGFIQAWHLALALASLAGVLGVMTHLQLMAGIHGLMMPLAYVGFPIHRFVVRLALTVQFAQNRPPVSMAPSWFAQALEERESDRAESVALELQKFRFRDAAFGLSAALLLWGLWQ